MQCPQCGKGGKLTNTRPRKSDGKVFPVYECTGNCKNERGYKFTWFPPRNQKEQGHGSDQGTTTIVILKEMSETLKRIEKILAGKNSVEPTPDGTSEYEPDIFS